MDDPTLVAAGRLVPDALDRVRRYCGLPWSGGPPETWAWPYYDALETAHDSVVTPVDVLAAGALHPGLSREDLTFFRQRSTEVSAWLDGLSSSVNLGDASDEQVGHIASLTAFEPDVSLTLLTKVLHRKRPDLIPLLDRAIIDWYRPVTGQRSPSAAWRPLLEAMRADLADPQCRIVCATYGTTLEAEMARAPVSRTRVCVSWLRIIDIAIWMGSR